MSILEPDQQRDIHYHQHVDVRGVVIPTWVAILLAFIGFSSSVVVLLSVLVFKTAADNLSKSQEAQSREIRVLILHLQDVENVLIRSRLAERKDFAEWSMQTKKE